MSSPTPNIAPTKASKPRLLPRLLFRQLLAFVLRVTRGFSRNGGVVLSGALAYNTLLSVPPVFLLATAVFAQLVDRAHFIRVVTRDLHRLLPSSKARPLIELAARLTPGNSWRG
jgi:uncharacterized BrkB/YihY/UPF0761 family membrane protein